MRCLFAIIIGICIPSIALAQDGKVGGKTAKEWSAALKHTDPRIRYKAVAALYEEGVDAAPLVKELIPLLKDPQPAIRRAVAQTMANCKGDAAAAVPALVAAFKDSDYWVRYLASNALSEIGEAAAPLLIDLLADKDATTRLHAVFVMNGLGLQSKDVAKALGKATKDASANVRQAALFTLSKIETDDPDIFAILGAALADKEKQVRLSAASILVGKGREGSGVLAKATEDSKTGARILALQSLAALGDEIDEKGVLALRKALSDEDVKVRQTAALGIANVSKFARELGGNKELFDALAKLLQEKDAQLRRTAMYAIGQIGCDDADEMKKVAGAMKDPDAMVRSFTVQALARFLTETESEDNRKELFGYLIDTLKDGDRRVQFLAAQSLAQQPVPAIEPLIKLVEEGKGTQRLWAATILGELGPLAIEAGPALMKMSKDASPEARRVALLAIQKIQAEVK